jgi:8-oxo-dGTP pyrophosphatase MutT (NUDIX family)
MIDGLKNIKILKFSEYLKESSEFMTKGNKPNAAGVALLYNNKILLVHPTGGSWQKGTCGIPKGGIEPGEEPIDAALRELREETGIILSKDKLDLSPEVVHIHNKKGTRSLIYFICKISDLSEIGLTSEKIPNSMLQPEEIDWSKFVDADTAYPIMCSSQLLILDRHLLK